MTTSLRSKLNGREISQQCCIPTSQSRGLSDIITSSACATPPNNRRRLFNPKSLRSPFGTRRSNSSNLDESINSTLSGESEYINYILYNNTNQ